MPCGFCGYATENGHHADCLAGVGSVVTPIAVRPWFDGSTFEPKLDLGRLGRQMLAVYRVMEDGQWRTLTELAFASHSPEASVSARLRDLRKARWGSNQVERRRRSKGTHEYRLVKAKAEEAEPWWSK
jgi:hypothetical protein